jgi:hypothetical protein
VIAELCESEQVALHSVIGKVVYSLEAGGYLPAPRTHLHGAKGTPHADQDEEEASRSIS